MLDNRISKHFQGDKPPLGPVQRTGQRRALIGWNHKTDTAAGLRKGQLWVWVSTSSNPGTKEKLQVYDTEGNRADFRGMRVDCGPGNFSMVRMFHPYWCPDDRELYKELIVYYLDHPGLCDPATDNGGDIDDDDDYEDRADNDRYQHEVLDRARQDRVHTRTRNATRRWIKRRRTRDMRAQHDAATRKAAAERRRRDDDRIRRQNAKDTHTANRTRTKRTAPATKTNSSSPELKVPRNVHEPVLIDDDEDEGFEDHDNDDNRPHPADEYTMSGALGRSVDQDENALQNARREGLMQAHQGRHANYQPAFQVIDDDDDADQADHSMFMPERSPPVPGGSVTDDELAAFLRQQVADIEQAQEVQRQRDALLAQDTEFQHNLRQYEVNDTVEDQDQMQIDQDAANNDSAGLDSTVQETPDIQSQPRPGPDVDMTNTNINEGEDNNSDGGVEVKDEEPKPNPNLLDAGIIDVDRWDEGTIEVEDEGIVVVNTATVDANRRYRPYFGRVRKGSGSKDDPFGL